MGDGIKRKVDWWKDDGNKNKEGYRKNEKVKVKENSFGLPPRKRSFNVISLTLIVA